MEESSAASDGCLASWKSPGSTQAPTTLFGLNKTARAAGFNIRNLTEKK